MVILIILTCLNSLVCKLNCKSHFLHKYHTVNIMSHEQNILLTGVYTRPHLCHHGYRISKETHINQYRRANTEAAVEGFRCHSELSLKLTFLMLEACA